MISKWRIFGLKRDEVTGERRKLHDEELHDLYSPPDIIRVIKSRRMKWAGHVARLGERRGVYRFWLGDLRERDHMEDQDIDGRTILRWIFWRWDGARIELILLRRRTDDGHLYKR
jgi:hypothetical protein